MVSYRDCLRLKAFFQSFGQFALGIQIAIQFAIEFGIELGIEFGIQLGIQFAFQTPELIHFVGPPKRRQRQSLDDDLGREFVWISRVTSGTISGMISERRKTKFKYTQVEQTRAPAKFKMPEMQNSI